MKNIVNFHITVYGRVQGVGYRFFAKKTAENIGIFGYVKNKVDGTVFIEAEGDQSSLNTFLNLCRKGPAWARVDQVKYTEYPTSGYLEFRIK